MTVIAIAAWLNISESTNVEETRRRSLEKKQSERLSETPSAPDTTAVLLDSSNQLRTDKAGPTGHFV